MVHVTGRCFLTVLLVALAVIPVAPAAAQTATITGTITASNGQPLPPASASSTGVYAVLGTITSAGSVQQVASAETSASGAYTLTGVTPGTYYLYTLNNSRHVNKTWDGYACVGLCDSLDFSGTVTLTPAQTLVMNFVLDPSAVISGRVVDSLTRAPVPGVFMTLSHVRQGVVASMVTDAGGFYSFPNTNAQAIAGSSYYVIADTLSSGPYVGQAFPGLSCNPTCRLTDATAIRVAPAQTVGGIDFLLERTGAVTGRVTDAATGAPLRATVYARRVGGNTLGATATLGDGSYNISQLPQGQYQVFTAAAFNPSVGYVGQGHGGVALPHCFTSGPSPQCLIDVRAVTPVSVTPATPTEGIDFRLTVGGSIAGRVSRGGQPIQADVVIYDASGARLTTVRSGFNGNYEVLALVPGTYFVGGGQPGQTRRLGCDEGSCIPSAGTPVVVAEGARTAGVDVDVPLPSGTVRGVVRNSATAAPLAGTLRLFDGDRVVDAETAAADGSYTFSDVTPGVYRLSASMTGFVEEWYDNVCAACGHRGNPVVVTADTTTTADFQLDPAGRISGTITLGPPEKSPIGIFVEALRSDGTAIAAANPSAAFVNGTAAYTIDGLPSGSYYVRAGSRTVNSIKCCFVSGGEYATELFNGIDCDGADCPLTSATAVTVVTGATTSGIDLVLDPAASVTATVMPEGSLTGSLASSLSFSARIQAFTPDGRPAGIQLPQQFNRTATIVGLRPGRFFFKAFGPEGYADQLYKDLTCPGCAPEMGTPVTVSAERRTHIDFTLLPGGAISGTVRDDADSRPLPGISMSVFTESGAFAATTTTNVSGRFVFSGLPGGRYFVSTSNVMGYADEVYDNAQCGTCDPLRGSPIDVKGGVETPSIDFRLTRGVLLSGRVTDASGAGAALARVSVFNAAGTLVARATSTQTGAYAVSAPAGSNFARLEPLEHLASRLYAGTPCPGGTCDPTTGTPIAGAVGAIIRGIDFAAPVCVASFLSPASLPVARLGAPYAATVTASGGGPFTYAWQSGTLPAGLTVEAGTGRISGTPAVSGRFAFVVGAADANGCGTSRAYTLDIAACTPNLPTNAFGERVFDMPGRAGVFSLLLDGSCPAPIAYNVPWLSRSRDLGPGVLEVAVAANPAGRRTGSVTIGNRTVTVNQGPAMASTPFGSFDTPSDGAAVAGSVGVTGWALDDLRVLNVGLVRSAAPNEPPGDVFLGYATIVPGARPDVERLFPEYPYASRAGWGYLLLSNMLPNQGNGTFTLTARTQDADGHTVTLGTRTIVVNNTNATQPFGAIDTPQQGATISGASFVNFGWALTPQPKTIPLNGSTIRVFIDGAAVGTVSYNHFRQDIASLFPGLNNSSGPVGFRTIDTTALADGLHTIAWVVTDDSGAAEGIGSRYFTVANGSAQFTSGVLSPPRLLAAPASAAVRHVMARELEPISIDLAPDEPSSCRAVFSGVERVGAEQRALPVGSSLDRERGVFRWQPGPGFIGTYRLSFDVGQCDGSVKRIDVDVTISRS